MTAQPSWSGPLPDAWATTSLRRLTASGGLLTDGDWVESPYITSEGNRLIQTGNIGIGRYREQGFRYISDDSFDDLHCTEVLPGDLLVCRLGDPVSRSCIAPHLGVRMLTSVDVCIARLSGDVDCRYFNYVLSSTQYLDWVGSQVRGSTRDRVSRSMLAQFPLPSPPSAEQRRIADFLDYETGEIDAFIADQERLIDLLTERRDVQLVARVTGCAEGVALRHSTVGWTSDVPQSWTEGNIRRFAAMRTGHTPSRSKPEYWQDCTIPWFTLADVWQLRAGHRELGETRECISDVGLEHSAADLLPAGTVVLSRTASVGFSGIMPRPMATSQDYWNWVCGPKLLPEYLWYQFQAMKPYLRGLMHGSTHKTIYQGDAAALRVLVPPIQKQRAIVEDLDSRMQKTNAAIADARGAIALSRERRAALISAAVTGQIDVRDWKQPTTTQ